MSRLNEAVVNYLTRDLRQEARSHVANHVVELSVPLLRLMIPNGVHNSPSSLDLGRLATFWTPPALTKAWASAFADGRVRFQERAVSSAMLTLGAYQKASLGVWRGVDSVAPLTLSLGYRDGTSLEYRATLWSGHFVYLASPRQLPGGMGDVRRSYEEARDIVATHRSHAEDLIEAGAGVLRAACCAAGVRTNEIGRDLHKAFHVAEIARLDG